ncbi:S-acyl fatty acid synthase thioesterase, medium chain isoform X3 [Cervus canadensis]|uniref:S-acyl fatty acid synthase thioesterase, medium chain isoform X3 n=2 Tax=Cervus canadensis TaxID=1574408 RepID=UPI001C9E83FB|nr:S-acyl fatty acid synthase thioesterase, medium chain isoform X3 [Cervus canadensis]
MESRDKAETIRNEKVVNCLYQNRNALFRLVCFPWGGGGSNFFAKWGQDIPNSVEVHAIRLAGRESRLDEPFASDMHQVVDEIACALLPIIQGENFAFFGHSMGSYIAFFTALHLKEKYNLEPEHLFVSSVSPPHEMGGIRDDFVGDEEQSQESFTKVLADLHILKDVICNTHSKTRLSCDITCFSGSEDIPADMEAWKDVTSGNFDSFVLPGHHFYLLEPSNTSFIKKYIAKSLEISALAS